MIRSKTDYYKARAREHRRLAGRVPDEMTRGQHEQLVAAYNRLARDSLMRQRVVLRAA